MIFCNRLPNGHINFEKFWQLAKQVTEVGAWQQVTCPFPKVQAVLNALQNTPILSETGTILQVLNALCDFYVYRFSTLSRFL